VVLLLLALFFAACDTGNSPATRPNLADISVATQPNKVAYTVGEGFTAAGLAVTALYSDGSTAAITGYTLSWNGAALANGSTAITVATGPKTITVAYEGKTATFDIIVSPSGVTLAGISVTTQPSKIAYTVGEAFTAAGLAVTASYSDDSTAPVTTGYTLSWNGAALAEGSTAITAATGSKTITVAYEGETATFDITVSSLSAEPIAQVSVNFTGPADEAITLTGVENTLSVAANTSITVSVTGAYIAYRWALDGEEIWEATDSFLTGDVGSLEVKRHTLTVFVTTSAGIEYAKRVTFTVTN
jgi:hypothetical protein